MALPIASAVDRAIITTAQIAAAITDAGLKVSEEQVTLLADVVAKTSTPALQVQSMERWGDHRLRVRLACATSDQCLPFMVSVRCSQDCSPHPASGGARPMSAGVNETRRTIPGAYVVRAGSSATLRIDGGHVHIELSVICLENGAAGQTIRVASNDRSRTYTAQVVDGTLLRSVL
jgi:hypothetical protein